MPIEKRHRRATSAITEAIIETYVDPPSRSSESGMPFVGSTLSGDIPPARSKFVLAAETR